MSSDDDDDAPYYDDAVAEHAREQVAKKLNTLHTAAQPTLITDFSVLPDLNAIYAARSSNTKAAATGSSAPASSSAAAAGAGAAPPSTTPSVAGNSFGFGFPASTFPATAPASAAAGTAPSSGFATAIPFAFGSMSATPATAQAGTVVAPPPTAGFSSIPFSFAPAAPSSAASGSQPSAPAPAVGFSSSVPFSFAPAAAAASTSASTSASQPPAAAPSSGFSSSIPFSFAAPAPAPAPATVSTQSPDPVAPSFSPPAPDPAVCAVAAAATGGGAKGSAVARESFDPAAELSPPSFAFPSSLVSVTPAAAASKEEAAALMRELRRRHAGAKDWSLHTKEQPQPFSSDLVAQDIAAAEAAAAAAATAAAAARAASEAAAAAVPAAAAPAPALPWAFGGFGAAPAAAAAVPPPAAAAAAPAVWTVPGFYSRANLPSFASVPVGPVKTTLQPLAPAASAASAPAAFDPSLITQPKTTFGFSFASVDPSKFASLAAAATGAFAPRQLPRADGRPLDVYKDILVSIFRMLHFPDLHWCMGACKEWQQIAMSMNALKLAFRPNGRLLLMAKRLSASPLAAKHMGHLLLSPHDEDAGAVSEAELNLTVQKMTSLQTVHAAIRPSSAERVALVLPPSLRELRLVVQPLAGRAPPHPDMWSCLANLPALTILEVRCTLFPLSLLRGHASLTSLFVPEVSMADVESLRTLHSLEYLELSHTANVPAPTSAEVLLALFAAPSPFPALTQAEVINDAAMDWPQLGQIYRCLPMLQTLRWIVPLSPPRFDYSPLYALSRLHTLSLEWVAFAAWFQPPEAQATQTAAQLRDVDNMIAPIQSLRCMRVLSLADHPQLHTAALSAMLSQMAQLEELTLRNLPRVESLSFLAGDAAPYSATLRRLRLTGCRPLQQRSELAHLTGLPSLKLLHLQGVCMMMPEAVHALEDGLLPQLPFVRSNQSQDTMTLYATDPTFLRLC